MTKKFSNFRVVATSECRSDPWNLFKVALFFRFFGRHVREKILLNYASQLRRDVEKVRHLWSGRAHTSIELGGGDSMIRPWTVLRSY